MHTHHRTLRRLCIILKIVVIVDVNNLDVRVVSVLFIQEISTKITIYQEFTFFGCVYVYFPRNLLNYAYGVLYILMYMRERFSFYCIRASSADMTNAFLYCMCGSSQNKRCLRNVNRLIIMKFMIIAGICQRAALNVLKGMLQFVRFQ